MLRSEAEDTNNAICVTVSFPSPPSLRPPFIYARPVSLPVLAQRPAGLPFPSQLCHGQSACPSRRSGLQLDPSLPRVASQPARLGAAARRFPLPIAAESWPVSLPVLAQRPAARSHLAARGQSACPSWRRCLMVWSVRFLINFVSSPVPKPLCGRARSHRRWAGPRENFKEGKSCCCNRPDRRGSRRPQGAGRAGFYASSI